MALRRALLRVAAVPVQELPFGVFHRNQLQLEVTRGLRHLGGVEESEQGYRGCILKPLKGSIQISSPDVLSHITQVIQVFGGICVKREPLKSLHIF